MASSSSSQQKPRPWGPNQALQAEWDRNQRIRARMGHRPEPYVRRSVVSHSMLGELKKERKQLRKQLREHLDAIEKAASGGSSAAELVKARVRGKRLIKKNVSDLVGSTPSRLEDPDWKPESLD